MKRIVAVVTLVCALAGCSGYNRRSALETDQSLRAEDIDQVVVLPVIDARPERFFQVRVSSNVSDATIQSLRARGYFTLTADGFREQPPASLDLQTVGGAELVPLAPEDAKYFMLIQVERIDPGTDRNAMTYDARLSAVLVDREHARVVWRDVATASSTMSGALALFSRGRGSQPYEAAINASRLLVQTLPDRRIKEAKRNQ